MNGSHIFLFALLLCAQTVPVFSSQELLRDDFDRFNSQTWGAPPPDARIVFRNQLNQTNGSLRLNPAAGGSHIISDEMFREASIEFEAKANALSNDSTIFYYFGFHNTQPWTHDLLWLVVQDSTIKLQARENGGPFFEMVLCDMPLERWVKFRMTREGKRVVVLMDGEVIADVTAPEISDRPMSAFLGANSVGGVYPADLQVDSVQVDGDPVVQSQALREPRAMTAKEKALVTSRKVTSGANWTVSMANGQVTLAGPEASYSFTLNEGITWNAIDRIASGKHVSGLAAKGGSPIYSLRVGDTEVDSRDLEITAIEQPSELPRLKVTQRDPESGVVVHFAVDLRADASLALHLQITNASNVERVVAPAFPIIKNVEIDKEMAGLSYFFPWRGGLMGKVPANLSTEYGGLGWMQVIAAFNEKSRSGIFFYPEDSTGILKGLMLKKTVRSSEDRVNFSEIIHPADMPSLNLAASDGMGMATYYFREPLAPGASFRLPVTRLKAYEGDWREPLREYTAWVKEWYKPVAVPRWFQDSYTFLNQHPPSYFDKVSGRYIGAAALQGSEHVVQWAFWESLKVPHVGPNFNGYPQYQPGDFVPSIARGGVEPFREEITAYRQKGTRFVPYINYRFNLRASEVGTRHPDWAAMREPGSDFRWPPFPEEVLLMSFYDPSKWPSFMAESAERLVGETGMNGVYLDELPLQYPNYNPSHMEFQKGRSTSTEGMKQSLTLVREALKRADPDAVLWTEHVGSDFMSQFIDGSWTQTFHEGFPFSEQFFDDNRLVYFRFAFPSVKLAEWGSSKRHVHRFFFNGMGWDFGTGNRGLSRILGNALREVSDAINTMTPEPLVPTTHPKLLANRFDSQDKIVYTFYNVSDQPITGFILEPAPYKGHYVDTIDDVELPAANGAAPRITLGAESVKAVVLFRDNLAVSRQGRTIHVESDKNMDSPTLEVFADEDDSHLLSSRGARVVLNNGRASFRVDELFATNPRRLIIKLKEGDYLVDQRIVKMSD